MAASILLAIALMALASGVRPDIKVPGALAFLTVKLVFAGSVVALTFAGLLRLARPGKEYGTSSFLLALPFAAIGVLAVMSLLSTPSGSWDELVMGHGGHSLIVIPIMATVPYVVLIWALRKAAPIHLWRVGALAGLAAGAVSAGAYAFSCTEDSFPFVACWYSGMILVCAILGACAPIVKKTLFRIEGVRQVSVRERAGAASVTVLLDDEKVSPEALARATTNAGFPSSVKTVTSVSAAPGGTAIAFGIEELALDFRNRSRRRLPAGNPTSRGRRLAGGVVLRQ